MKFLAQECFHVFVKHAPSFSSGYLYSHLLRWPLSISQDCVFVVVVIVQQCSDAMASRGSLQPSQRLDLSLRRITLDSTMGASLAHAGTAKLRVSSDRVH